MRFGGHRVIAANHTSSWKRNDRDVRVITSEGSEIIRIARDHNSAAEAESRRDDRRVHGVARGEIVATEQAACGPSDAMVERHDAIGTPHDPIDRGIATGAPIDLGEHGGRDADERVAPGSFSEDSLRPAGGHTALTRHGKGGHRLAVEDHE